jgi:DNA-binding transcriptional LysR family regulator
VLVSRSSDPGLHDSIITACKGAGFNPHITYETDDVYTGLRIVAAGLGVSLLPALRHFQQPGVILRHLQSPAPQIEMAVAYSDDNPSQLLQHFLGVLHDIADGVQLAVDGDAAADRATFDTVTPTGPAVQPSLERSILRPRERVRLPI